MYKSGWFCKSCNHKHWSGGSNDYFFSPDFCKGCGEEKMPPRIGQRWVDEEDKIFEHRIYRIVKKRKSNVRWWNPFKYQMVVEYAKPTN